MNECVKNKRTIVFSAYPKYAGELKTFFSTVEGSVRRQLENPPRLRAHGWDLWTSQSARVIGRDVVRTRHGESKVIDLYRDGNLIFAARVDTLFGLGWGSQHDQINAVAIVEVVYNFVNFYSLVLEDFKRRPEEISIRVDFRNLHMGGIRTYLIPFNCADAVGEGRKRYAPEGNGMVIRDFRSEDFRVGVVAFEVVKAIYLWFGWKEHELREPGATLYTKTEDGVEMVDAEQIRRVK